MERCRYCNKELVRKIYSNGRKESEKHLKERIYCNRECLKKDYVIRNKSWTNDEENILTEGYKKNTPMKNQSNPYSRAKGGKRKDLDNIYFRSSWEANIARYYNYLGIKWEYEPKTFVFKNITRGSVSYTPDFYIPEEDKWIEVKGWMDSKSKTKLRRFKDQYPEEYSKLVLIQEKEYNSIKRKLSCFIKNWE